MPSREELHTTNDVHPSPRNPFTIKDTCFLSRLPLTESGSTEKVFIAPSDQEDSCSMRGRVLPRSTKDLSFFTLGGCSPSLSFSVSYALRRKAHSRGTSLGNWDLADSSPWASFGAGLALKYLQALPLTCAPSRTRVNFRMTFGIVALRARTTGYVNGFLEPPHGFPIRGIANSYLWLLTRLEFISSYQMGVTAWTKSKRLLERGRVYLL